MSAEGPGGAAYAGAGDGGPVRLPRQQVGPDRGRGEHHGGRADGGGREERDGGYGGPDARRDGRDDRNAGQGDHDPGRDGGEEASSGDADGKGDAAERDRAEWEEKQRREGERFKEAMQDPFPADGAAGGSRAANRSRSEGRARFTVHGNSSVFDRTRFGHAHFGDVYLGAYTGAGDAGSAVLGEVPEEELVRLGRTYRAPDGYQTLKETLRRRRVLVVVGPPGTGRRTTALCLLDELTSAVREEARSRAVGKKRTGKRPADGPDGPGAHEDAGPHDAERDGGAGLEGGVAPDEEGELPPGQVTRLDPSSLGHILRDPAAVARRVAPGGGFVLHLPDAPGDWTPPGEAHLGALAAALAARDAYAVLVASPSTPAGALLTGRHALRCPSAPAPELLSWHLMRRLADGGDAAPDALDRGEQILHHPLLRQALGIPLDDLRPAETDALAALVVRHLRRELTRAELLDRCGDVVRAQVETWFAGARHRATVTDGAGAQDKERAADEANRALLRLTAFRVALAVLDGEAFSSVADAADLLAGELLTALAPGQEHGRPVFAEDWDGLLAAARAEFGESEDESVAGVPLPVRTVRYRGAAFAGAVLAEVWQRHHAARAPVVRWLRALADDPRPQVWVRAAVAAGELCTADPGYGFVELLAPLASARSARRRYAAATALDQAGRREPYRTAVRAVVDEWAHADAATLRWTAALTLGHGRVEPDTRTAVEILGRLGTRDEGGHLQVASYALTRLAAGSRAAETLTLLNEWAAQMTGDRRDLALLTGLRLCTAPCDDYWEPESPDAETDADVARPDRREGEGEGEREGEGARASGSRGAGSRGGSTDPADAQSRQARAVRSPGRVGAMPSASGVAAARFPGLSPTAEDRPAVPRADVTVVDAGMGRLRDWPLALAVAVAVPAAAGPLAGLLWRVFDSHLSGERAVDGLASWLRAAERDAAPTSGGELLRALVWFLPLLIREERDWQRLDWVLGAMAADPAEPTDEHFVGHVLDVVGAGLRGRRGEQP